jgi:hypothetical protein
VQVSQASCLYQGTIEHRRSEPDTAFVHRIVLAYIDLAELPNLLGGRLVRNCPGPVRFRRADYHGPAELPLGESVRQTVRHQSGHRPEGPIRLLTNLRSFGHCFNPVSFYYCFDRGGTLDATMAEVTNTPWGERHAYVIPGGTGDLSKALHVSPFMGMDHSYHVAATAPGDRLEVSIASRHGADDVFSAKLSLERDELTPRSLRQLELRYPLASARVLALIYGHAIGLKLAGARVFPHPKQASE